MDRILQMIINTVLRLLLNRGVKAGIDRFSRARPADPADLDQSQDAKAVAKRARDAANIARRLGR